MTKHQMYEQLLTDEHEEYGACRGDPRVQELVWLRVEDYNRKGCTPEKFEGGCRDCPQRAQNNTCPYDNYQSMHPEFINDGIEQRIKTLETELYGWHIPSPVHTVTERIGVKTVSELIAKLKELPSDGLVDGTVVIKIQRPVCSDDD